MQFLKDGIPYLNDDQEKELVENLSDLLDGVERNVMYEDEDRIKETTSNVAEWLQVKRELGDEQTFKFCGSLVVNYLLHRQVRANHELLWSFNKSKVNIIYTVRRLQL